MKSVRAIMLLCGIAACIGALLFAVHQQWIIFQFPATITHSFNSNATKQALYLSYWHDGQWHTETQEFVRSGNLNEDVSYIVANWLSFLEDEQLSPKKISLQTALVDPQHTAVYLSFDQTPFVKESSTISKWLWIQGLLKTIRSNSPEIQNVYILVNHQPLQDMHIDLSHPLSLIAAS